MREAEQGDDDHQRQPCEHLDPTGPAKTIIFCVDDDHAERLVPILKAALEEAWGPLEDDVVKKITGAVDRPLDQIRRFKNEANPKIAFVGNPVEVAIDSGSAKKARYASELPSIRNSSS